MTRSVRQAESKSTSEAHATHHGSQAQLPRTSKDDVRVEDVAVHAFSGLG